MDKKVKTIKVGPSDYAKVPDRIKAFREECPNGSIDTKPKFNDTGDIIMFTAVVKKEANKKSSGIAKGHAFPKENDKGGDKSNEKLETIAVGRALANLGYLASGEVASSEEMEEFHKDKKDKLDRRIEEVLIDLKKAKTLSRLKEVWADVEPDIKKEVEKIKDTLKEKLSKVTPKKNANTKVSK